MSRLPEKFEAYMRENLGADFTAFRESLLEPPAVSVRINPWKGEPDPGLANVPWTAHGQYLPTRPLFTLDPLLHAGAYYVQEASSMFLEQALRQTVNLQQSLCVLDLCAAPGGKSTHLLSLLSPESLLVSNEAIRSRASILSENIQKWGYPNAIVTNNDPEDFHALEGLFDVIVIDAPCSGEGLFRKDPGAMNEWSPENVQLCSSRQKRIVSDVWDALAENGILIYCTCTYNETENEDNLRWIQQQHAVEFLKLTTKPSWNIEEVAIADIFAYRFFPHKVTGEGFFLSAMRKKESVVRPRLKPKKNLLTPSKNMQQILQRWISPTNEINFYQFNDLLFYTLRAKEKEVEFLLQYLKIIYAGTNLGTIKHDKVIPDHALALSYQLNKGSFPSLDLTESEAIQYLRKDALQTNGAAMGVTLMTYGTRPLGWANVLANRINNMYPNEWRIRMVPPAAGGNK
jgi:16S rRNA C967 or C1407 C5-methylase (RsmB/RsmF family)/NOL1/NOP2/fmu family ribosome biogenesis protein